LNFVGGYAKILKMEKKNAFAEAARQYLAYALSLPERTVRSLAALAGGTSTLLTETLFPESLRETVTYNVVIGMMQRFVIERVAGMEGEISSGPTAVRDDYLQRKLVGNALEAAGLLTMSFSPLWVFAIAGDAAGGSQVFLNRLLEHLKANGVVDQKVQAASLVDVLVAVQDASAKSATAIDVPPLSPRELAELAREIRSSYGKAFKNTADLMGNLNILWGRMEKQAAQNNVSIEHMAGVMTVDALPWGKRGAGAVIAAGKTGAELFDEKVLDSYRRTLSAVADQGLDKYVGRHLSPFLQSAKTHFDPAQLTWTERALNRSLGQAGDRTAGDGELG
jgi:hypothetical protein